MRKISCFHQHNFNVQLATWLSQSEKDGLLTLTDGGKTTVTLQTFGLIGNTKLKLKLGPE